MAADDLTAILANRQGHRADFMPRSARALTRWPVRLSEGWVAGVPCQIIEPSAARAAARAAGTILYFFGGGYVSGSPDYDLAITAALAELGGFRILAPRYSLAPEAPFPVGLDECIAVYEALAAAGPLGLSGESAGGGMALSFARHALGAAWPRPQALVLFSPWGDLTDAGAASGAEIDDPTMTVEDVRLFARAYLGPASASDPRASPALGPFPSEWPPTLLTTGSRDMLGPMVRDLATRLPDARLIDRADMWHVFELYDECPEAQETLEAAAAFLAERFAPV